MVAVQQQTRPYTRADLANMPQDGQRYEVLGGELIVTAAPSTKHQRASMRLSRIISGHVEQNGLGEVFAAPFDVALGPHDIVEPDLLVVLNSAAANISDAGMTGPPDLVIEILSPSTRVVDSIRKSAAYAMFGVPEYWIVDPDNETITAQTLVEGMYKPIPASNDRIASLVITGLVVDPREVFAPPAWQRARK